MVLEVYTENSAVKAARVLSRQFPEQEVAVLVEAVVYRNGKVVSRSKPLRPRRKKNVVSLVPSAAVAT